jgi:hypothetical protein
MASGSPSSINRPVATAVARPPLFVFCAGLAERGQHIWRNDLIRLVGLTLYYLAIIAGLVILYGGAEYVPPPFVYQGF